MTSTKTRGLIALAACLLILVMVNLSISGKEQHLAHGRVVYLDLAPVDPRSLMQGDYMALNFDVAEQARRMIPEKDAAADGQLIITLDERLIGSFSRLHDGRTIEENEIALRYRLRNQQLIFATNGYFFKEGTGDLYENARYGKFRVDSKGELLLTRLCDENLVELGPG
jgi:uncharacterized membrane-anchored protein